MYNHIIPNGLPMYNNERLLNYKKPHVANFESGSFRNTLAYVSDTGQLYIPRLDIKRVTGGGAPDFFKLYAVVDIDTRTEIEEVSGATWDIQPLNDDFEVLLKQGGAVTITQPLDSSQRYQFVVASSGQTYYSEVFFVDEASVEDDTFPTSCDDGYEWIKLYWQISQSATVLDNTFHSDGGAWSMWLPVQLGQPTYQNVIQTEDTGDKNTKNTYQFIKKRFQFFIVGPEYLADVLNVLPLFQDVNLQWSDGSQMDIREIEVDTSWIEDDAAQITFSFVAPLAYSFERTGCVPV